MVTGFFGVRRISLDGPASDHPLGGLSALAWLGRRVRLSERERFTQYGFVANIASVLPLWLEILAWD